MSKRERSVQQKCRPNKTPSLSPSILDSIDDPHRRRDSNSFYAKKHNHSLKRAMMIEEWIEKQNQFSSDSLRKVKQPISPGARISTFLNSIFNSTKKANMCYVGAVDDVTFKSKSCMTKDSSRSRIKRSVRFYPVSVIIGEDSRPCGHKPLYYHDQEKKKNCVAGLYEEEDEEDTESCASSDLFELDHLIGIGRRYRDEELPVYETTCFNNNHAIPTPTAFNL